MFWKKSDPPATSMGPPGVSDGKATWVQTLGQEDAPKKGMATHSSTLTLKISWTEEPGGL